jgi:hypothetical protein
MKKCKKCGSNNFLICESLVHGAAIRDDEVLEAFKNSSNEIEDIICKECFTGYSINDFKDIEFNY